ncbi:hypothetical protein D3C76_1591780 [compost metagenome]
MFFQQSFIAIPHNMDGTAEPGKQPVGSDRIDWPKEAVAKIDDKLRPASLRILKYRLQSRRVAMYVGNDRKSTVQQPIPPPVYVTFHYNSLFRQNRNHLCKDKRLTASFRRHAFTEK